MGLVFLGVALLLVDISRPAEKQWTPALYGEVVHVYQWAKPRCGVKGCCRFDPSCSRYSAQVVHEFGMIEGMRLTADRLDRCRTNIPLGTSDPIPQKGEPSQEE